MTSSEQLGAQRGPDPLSAEFMYYASVLRNLGPLTKEDDRRKCIPWIRKLFGPEYHTTKFRDKRNRYLVKLTTSLLLDEIAAEVFKKPPGEGPLEDFDMLEVGGAPAAEWESDAMWKEVLVNMPEGFKMLECSVHATKEECQADHLLDNILDQEFQFLLHLARPYASLLPEDCDRTRVAAWLQILCSIHGKSSCSSMKAIRNDYIMVLLSYLQDLRAIGPFRHYPPWNTLVPIAEAAKNSEEDRPITDPTCSEACEFMGAQQVPEDGAFCYVAITGDLIGAAL